MRKSRSTTDKAQKMSERAEVEEKTARNERAGSLEKTRVAERADGVEKTEAKERAGKPEKTATRERAAERENPEQLERAAKVEKAGIAERAVEPEKTGAKERAEHPEKTATPKRAAFTEKNDSGERAATTKKTVSGERAAFSEKPEIKERAVVKEKTAARERAAAVEKTVAKERAANNKKTARVERTAPTVGTRRGAAPSPSSWALVRRLADSYDDIQRLRIAIGNRLVKLGRDEQVGDAHMGELTSLADDLAKHEASMAAAMRSEVHAHIMGDWLVAHRGIAEQSAATIIATLERRPHWSGCRAPKVKDRCDAAPADFDAWNGAGPPFCPHSTWIDPKHPSSFWKFCGLYPGARKERGKVSEFNGYARVRMYRIATNMIRSGNEEYGAIYRQAKQRYLQYPTIHDKGPDDSGHALYADLMARRVMIKEFLLRLHIEWSRRLNLPPSEPYAMRVHRGETPQTPPEYAAGASA